MGQEEGANYAVFVAEGLRKISFPNGQALGAVDEETVGTCADEIGVCAFLLKEY